MSDMPLALRRRRALYRATHRGSKEMDFLLGRFASKTVPDMSAADLAVFERLNDAPDPMIAASIYDGISLGDEDLDALVSHMRRFHGFPMRPGQGGPGPQQND